MLATMSPRIRLYAFLYLLAGLVLSAASGAQAFNAVDTKAKQAIVVDYDTGAILFSKNATEQMPTSSMSKVLTVYVILKAIEQGHMKLDQMLTVSEKAWRMEGSKTFLPLNSQASVDDLLHGVVIQSGNDATVVLAEGLAGTEEAFAALMNKEAKRMGMANSNFVNSSGWPDPNHYSTAKDLAILGWNLIHDFPEYYKIYSVKEFEYNGITQGNRNPLVQKGVGDGIKTGHTDAAGYGLIGSGKGADGRRVVFVVNGYETLMDRYNETPLILDWALKNFANVPLFKKGTKLTESSVVLGQVGKVGLGVDKDLTMTLPRFNAEKVKMTANFKTPLVAPLQAGQKVGTVRVEIPNMPAQEVDLVTTEAVAEQGLFGRAIAKAMIKFVGL